MTPVAKYEFQVKDIPTSAECPVSLITPFSRKMVSIIADAELVREYTGANVFGTDCADWDEWYWDAVLCVAIEKKKVEIAQFKEQTRRHQEMLEQVRRGRGEE